MRFAVKSAGGITEAFLHADNVDEAVKDAAKQIAADYDLPVDLELWTAPPQGGHPSRRAEFRFVAVDQNGDVIDLG